MKAIIGAMILLAVASMAWAGTVRQVVIYDQATGEIIEVANQGSDMSRWAGTHGVLTGQQGVNREKHKVVGGKVQGKSQAELNQDAKQAKAAALEHELATVQAKVSALEAAGADQADIDKARLELQEKQAQWASKKGGN